MNGLSREVSFLVLIDIFPNLSSRWLAYALLLVGGLCIWSGVGWATCFRNLGLARRVNGSPSTAG